MLIVAYRLRSTVATLRRQMDVTTQAIEPSSSDLLAEMAAETGLPFLVDEPLVESAGLAERWSRRLCLPATSTGFPCRAYHGSWQYLRALGVTTALATHAEFLVAELRRRARNGMSDRVLISGSADYSMLAHVLFAYSQEGRMPSVTMVDQCATPILLNRWYARRLDVKISSTVTDLTGFCPEQPFDVICTHNFIAFFGPDRYDNPLSKWREFLRPGGIVITADRVGRRPGSPGERTRTIERRIREAAAKRQAWFPALDVDHLVETTLHRARYAYSIPVQSRDALEDLFRRNGFRVETMRPEDATSRRGHRRLRDLPSAEARYQIVAVREG